MAAKNPSIIIDDNFRRFKAEREKGDSDIQKCENQKKLIGKNKSSHPVVFFRKADLKICSKFAGEHP